jgi:hypothetical protein
LEALMEDDAKDRVDGFIKIAEYWASRHDGRREFEWKVTLGWWGLLVLAIHYVHLPCSLRNLRIWEYAALSGVAALILLYLFVHRWLYPLWKANKFDKDKSYAAVGCAEALLNPVSQKIPDQADRSLKFSADWSMKFQTLTTLVLLIVLCVAARY